jgi:hypothetical protein
MKLVDAWIEIYHKDLEVSWKLFSNSEEYFKIAPLKSGEIKLFNVSLYISGTWYGS